MKKAIRIISLVLAVVIMNVFTLGAFAESIKAKGVDVSYWQGTIDFNKVKSAGIDFVIMRIGTSYGKDSTFEKNYENAKKAGLDVGCYFYTYATTVEKSRDDAKKVIEWIGNKKMEYPVYFDIEDMTLEGLSQKEKMDICEAFISYVKQAGFLPGLYCNYNWMTYHLDGKYCKENYDVWLANWTDSGLPNKDKSSECRLWQYSASGEVSGISGGVDMDVSYFDYPSYVVQNGLNNYPKQGTPETPENPTEPEIPDTSFTDQIKVLTKIIAKLMEAIKIFVRLIGVA